MDANIIGLIATLCQGQPAARGFDSCRREAAEQAASRGPGCCWRPAGMLNLFGSAIESIDKLN